MSGVLLFDEDQEDLTPRFKEVLAEVFKRFDVDGDGALNREELNAFATVCNGAPFDEDSLEQILTFETDSNNNLLLEGLVQMYTLQTASDPSETRKDLRKLGYDRNLKKI